MLNLTSTVIVIAPEASVRAVLGRVIRRGGLSLKTFASAGEFLAHAPISGPSSLVMEVAVFDLVGLEVLRRIATERRGMPIIVVAAESDIPMTVQAMKAGAVEFLLNPRTDADLLSAIENAIARSSATLAQAAQVTELRSRYDSLSVREREVMTHVVAGQLNKHVGAELGISEITVKAHRGKMMRKMGAKSLVELVIMAMRLEPVPMVTALRRGIGQRHVDRYHQPMGHARSLRYAVARARRSG